MKPCVLCSPGNPRLLFQLPKVRVLECRDCGLAFVDETISGGELQEMYNAENYYKEEFTFYVEGIEDKITEDNLASFARAGQCMRPGKILDVGCADGVFLGKLDPHVWERHGLDISERAIQKARESWDGRGITFYRGEFLGIPLPAGYFDVVTLWMVVEHLNDPLAVFRKINQVLAPGGIVVVKTPNRDSLLSHFAEWLYRVSLRRFSSPLSLYYTFLHLYFFDEASLSRLLRMSGFEVAGGWQEERYVTRHALARFKWWKRIALRSIVALSRWARKMDALVLCGRKQG